MDFRDVVRDPVIYPRRPNPSVPVQLQATEPDGAGKTED